MKQKITVPSSPAERTAAIKKIIEPFNIRYVCKQANISYGYYRLMMTKECISERVYTDLVYTIKSICKKYK